MTNYQHDILVAHVYCAAALATAPSLLALSAVAACIFFALRAWEGSK
jgi:hypothetical protein